jgi:hypothetical protein
MKLPLILLGTAMCMVAQDTDKTARSVMEPFFVAWNKADNVELRKSMNFPFVTLGRNGAAQIAMKAEDFTQDFDALRRNENWASSTLDAIDVTPGSTADKIHIMVTYSRYLKDGKRYMTGRTFYVLTRQNGHWGMQLRSPMAPKTP